MHLGSKTHTLGCKFDGPGKHTHTPSFTTPGALDENLTLTENMYKLCDLYRGKQKQNVQLISLGLFGWWFFSLSNKWTTLNQVIEFGGYERTQASWERKNAIRMESFPWVVLASSNHQQTRN